MADQDQTGRAKQLELQSITLNGFRKFETKTELKTNGKLVALLGPNEAGKTSALRAIYQVVNREKILDSDLSRGMTFPDKHYPLIAKFRLSGDDLREANIPQPTWFYIYKKINGSWDYRFDPKIHPRDISKRQKLLRDLERFKANNKIWGRFVNVNPSIVESYEKAVSSLSLTDETLGDDEIATIENVNDEITKIIDQSDPKYIRELPLNFQTLLDCEKSETPLKIAFRSIKDRVPKILFFSNDERLLEGSYDTETLSEPYPPALENLTKVAGIELRDLVNAVKSDDAPTIARLKSKANDELRRRFDENWSQSGVHVALDVLNGQILVLVREENYNFTKLAERSDGLRQFVALQAFTTCERADNPILLIDEAEMRLHYDAQADLIQMLSKQSVASKIIYTTHSAGCLPEDLGDGVRLVEQIRRDDGSSFSVIKNHFWNRTEGGLEPLLFGMGAATLAFFPIRRALLTEGESDMLLLPAMLREAFQADYLTFQIVPGLSKTSGINLPILARNGRGVAFAVDDDQGGRDLAKKIANSGFDTKAIFSLKLSGKGDGQIEDFINPKHLSVAVSAAFSELKIAGTGISPSSFQTKGRLDQIKAAYKQKRSSDIPKTLIAYHILESLLRNPDISIIDPKRKKDFEKFSIEVKNYFDTLVD